MKRQTSGDLFLNPDFDAERYCDQLARLPPAARNFGILFTPRSGSSWLTDVLSQTKLLGKPQEWFNPNFVPGITRALNANDLGGYIEMLRRKHKLGGFFSFEITLYQMQKVFGSEARFLELMPENTRYICLTREDMVAQAVSLAKAVTTEVFHAVKSSDAEITATDTAFVYDDGLILKWLDHIFELEKRTENFIATLERPVQRMTYEQITKTGAADAARQAMNLLRSAKAAEVPLPEFKTEHRKIGSSQNAEFAERFRAAHPALMDEIAAFRAGIQPIRPRRT